MAKYLTLNKQNPLFTHGWRLAPLFSSLSHHRQAQRHWASLVPRSNPQVSTCLSPPQELFCLGHWWLLTWRGQGHPQSSSYLTSLQRSVMWDQSLSFLKISLVFPWFPSHVSGCYLTGSSFSSCHATGWAPQSHLLCLFPQPSSPDPPLSLTHRVYWEPPEYFPYTLCPLTLP